MNALNQLMSIPESTPGHDRRGNLTQWYFPAGPQYYWTYSYDHENQLSSVATDTASTLEAYRFKVEFTYDGQGRLRVRKDYGWSGGAWTLSSETRYLYDGMLMVQERNGSNVPTVTYTRGRDLSGTVAGAGGIGGLLARSHGYSGGNWSYHNFYHADGNGNVMALVNSGGTLQASYKYDPFGRWLSGGGSLASANLLRFSSKPWVGFAGSTTSGLYYYGYRFYDPYLQRWVNRDPLGDSGTLRKLSLPYPYDDLLGSNGYVYCGNSPPNVYDKDGRVAPLILWSGLILWRKACGVTGLIVAKQKFPDYQDAKQHCYANCFATRCAGLLPPLDYFLIGLLWEIIDPSPDGREDLWANLDGIVGAYKLTEFCEDRCEQCPF